MSDKIAVDPRRKSRRIHQSHFVVPSGAELSPNMPYARVGALPQPQNDIQPSKQSRMGRQQGITMEDLKKQTAMRLAQEPSQPEFNQRKNERNMLQIHDLKRQTALRLAQEQEQSLASGQRAEGRMQILPPEQGQMQQYYGVPQSFAPVDPHRFAQDSRVLRPQPAENQSFSRYEGQRVPVNTAVNNRTQYVPNRSTPTVPNQHVADRSNQRNPANNRPESSLSTGSANSFGSGSTERKGGKSKPKLPHGLTVQELKEMTKARLQAEAADGPVDADPEPSNSVIQQQPYGRNAGDAVSPLSFVQDSSKPTGFQGRVSPHTPTPFQGRISPHTPTPFHDRISPHTPTPIVTARHEGMARRQPRDYWQQTGGGMDGWETASVASTTNSEYLGSESAYSSGYHQQDDSPGGVPFSRSRSFGGGGYEQHEARAPYFDSSSPFADFGSGQNRRRATTLSPRPGPALTYLHEDRPLGYASTSAGLPTFDSAGKGFPGIRTIDSDTFNNEPSSQSSSPARFWNNPGGVIGDGLSNRRRTASAPTVRSVSQPSDEFMARGNDPLTRLPSTHSLRLGGESSGEQLNAGFDSALGLSTTGGGGNGDDFSSVFRQPTGGVQRPPPGLFPDAQPSTPGLLTGSRSNDFGFGDGWGQPSLGSRSQEFQTRERAHTDGEALLADSLGSMLNVSAPRQPPIGHNTFVSRIDPEIDFNRRRAATSSPVSASYGIHEAFSTPNGSLFERDGAFRDDKSRYM